MFSVFGSGRGRSPIFFVIRIVVLAVLLYELLGSHKGKSSGSFVVATVLAVAVIGFGVYSLINRRRNPSVGSGSSRGGVFGAPPYGAPPYGAPSSGAPSSGAPSSGGGVFVGDVPTSTPHPPIVRPEAAESPSDAPPEPPSD